MFSALCFPTLNLALSSLAQNVTIVQYGSFTPTATYSVANQLGFFSDQNISVVYNTIPNSTYGYSAVLDGTYDILTGTIDNDVNLRFNSNKTVTVLGQVDEGPDLVIASIPSITNISQLAGLSLIVDSPTSGYAYLLRKGLSANGLEFPTDYSFQTVGGTPLRHADLTAGSLANGSTVYATILVYPFTTEAEAHGLNVLARISDYVSPISSTALTVAQSTLNSTTRDRVTRFVASTLAANRFLANPANKNCPIMAIQRQLNVSIAVAEAEYAAARSSISGETTEAQGGDFEVDQKGLANVVAVGEEFGGFTGVQTGFNFTDATISGSGKLIDYSVRNEALGRLTGFRPLC